MTWGVGSGSALPGSRLQYLSALAEARDPTELVGHFVLGSPPPVVPEGWRRASFAGWTVAAHPALPIRTLVDPAGAQLGWLLGHPLVPGSTTPSPARFVVDPDRLDESLAALAGRFVALAVSLATVVPDANATLPVLFDAGLRLVSSSPFLLVEDGEAPPDHPLASVVRVFDSGLWFLFDATPHARARRLIANHALDLRTWEQIRRWPRSSLPETDPEEATERAIASLQAVMTAALADAGTLNCALTAGGDTREILAASRPLVEGLRHFTVALPDYVGARDVQVSRRLAARFGLDHRVLEWRAPTRGDVELFMYRTGGLVGEPRGRLAGPTYAQLGARFPYVAGVNAAVGNVWRDMGWRPTDTPTTVLTPEDLLTRYFSPQHPLLLDRASDWLAGLPDLDTIAKLSLLSDELRTGGWGGALTTAYPDAYSYTLYPFSYRPLKEAIFGTSYALRTSGHIREDIVRRRWPELLDVPVNPITLRYRAGRRARAAAGLARAVVRRAAGGLRPP